jgi:hypothetical protein
MLVIHFDNTYSLSVHSNAVVGVKALFLLQGLCSKIQANSCTPVNKMSFILYHPGAFFDTWFLISRFLRTIDHCFPFAPV